MEDEATKKAVVGTFDDVPTADIAADAARHAGLAVDRPTERSVAVSGYSVSQGATEAEAFLGAYGAQEFAHSDAAEQALGVTTQHSVHLELIEEDLRARTRPVETGDLMIRTNVVVEETRTIERARSSRGNHCRTAPGGATSNRYFYEPANDGK
ncbi:MAG: hypothetical protein JO020_12810 [Chloroflexi bacterium]|nr:hypothetical protein [Chloroflexota bacterium]